MKPTKVNRMTKAKVVVQPAPQRPPPPQGTIPVQVKLTPTEKEFLDGLVRNGTFESRSAGIRAGLGLLFDHWKIAPELDRQIERERRIHAPRRSHRIK